MDLSKFIEENIGELKKKTNCDEILLEALRQADILFDYEVSSLNSVEVKGKRNSELWGLLKHKNIQVSALHKIFEGLNQQDVVNIFSKLFPASKGYTFLKDLKTYPVSVIRPTEEISHHDDGYNLNPYFIGLALIINVTLYDEPLENRNQTEQDSIYMCELWEQLGYKILQYEGRYTKEDINQIVESFCEKFRHLKHFESCVVFIGCHGELGKLVFSDTSKLNLYSDFVCQFEKDHLLGKPKIFIIQSCDHVLQDDRDQERVKIKDTTLCVSSFKDVSLGSYFVYVFTDVVMREAYRSSFSDVLKKVARTLYKILESQGINERYNHFRELDMEKLYFNVLPARRQ